VSTDSQVSSASVLGMRNLFHGKIQFLIAPEGFFQTNSQNKSRKIPLYLAECLRIWRIVSNFGDHHSEPGTKGIRQLGGKSLKQGAIQMKFHLIRKSFTFLRQQ
jgi:hypothetical protein